MERAASETSREQVRRMLAVVSLGLMMVVSAVSGLNTALPDLARDTGATQTELLWIVDAYTVVFAGLMLIAGALGDRYGRKPALMAGLGIYGAAAGLAFAVADPQILIVLRALMGIGAAFVMPVTLSIITTAFPEEERPRAIGLWVGVAGAGAVLGIFVTGVLLEFFAWNSFFALQVLLAVMALGGAVAVLPSSREENPPALDAGGAILSLLTVSGLVFGILEGADQGWLEWHVIGAMLAGALSACAFVIWELRQPRPLLDPRLFLLRGFSTGTLSITMQFAAAFGFYYAAMQYLQFIAGYSPLKTAAALLPMPLVTIPLARRAPYLARQFGMHRTGAGGLLLLALGLLTMSRIEVNFSYGVFAAGLVIFAAGMALAGTPATTAIVSALPPEKQGVASAVNDVSREFGSAFGIALLGSIANWRYRNELTSSLNGVAVPGPVIEHAKASIAFVQSEAVQRLGPAGEPLVHAAERAFVEGISAALVTGAILALVAAVVVALRGPRAAATQLVWSDASDKAVDSRGREGVA